MLNIPVVSEKAVGRLSLYRRLLQELFNAGTQQVFSHELAALAKGTSAQVRRDLMVIGYEGSPTRGYDIPKLLEALGRFLDPPKLQKVALVGVGNLGRALLSYFVDHYSHFTIAAAFDNDPAKSDRVVNGCPIYALSRMEEIVRSLEIEVAIIAVPKDEAQSVVQKLCDAGIRGILNFAPVRFWAPESVYVEHLDMTMSLERVSFYARSQQHDLGDCHVNGGTKEPAGVRG